MQNARTYPQKNGTSARRQVSFTQSVLARRKYIPPGKISNGSSILKATGIADVPPLDVLLAASALYERAGIAGRVDVEDLFDGFGDVHI